MAIEVFNLAYDSVIGSSVSLGQADYRYALDAVHPLINKFEAQRRFLDTKFYERLERDILKGCLMPPITLAFVEPEVKFHKTSDVQAYVEVKIGNGYILDGIQRLATLRRASEKLGFMENQPFFFNIIIADNRDKLLYRMITLNNGQKAMTPRHQIEILTQELFDFSQLAFPVQTEKEKSENPIKDAFSAADIAKAYTAFLTNSVHNENSKIIDEKMDQIIVDRILELDLSTFSLQFYDILQLLEKLSGDEPIRKWLQVANNLIGFSVGIKKSYQFMTEVSVEDASRAFETFDKAFRAVNPSKVNVGKFRRELSQFFVENAKETFTWDQSLVERKFSEITAS